MSKFQVGDRVVRVNDTNGLNWKRTGMDRRPIHEVAEVYADKIKLVGSPVWWWDHNFQHGGRQPERSCSDCTHAKSHDPKCGMCTGPGDPNGRFDMVAAHAASCAVHDSIYINQVPQPATSKEETVNTSELRAAQKAAAKADAKLAAARAELDAATKAAAEARTEARNVLNEDISLASATYQLLTHIKDTPGSQLSGEVEFHATQLEPLANKYGYTIRTVAGRAFLEEV